MTSPTPLTANPPPDITTTNLPDTSTADTATTDAANEPIIPLPPPFNLTSPPPTLLTQGAEALVYRTHFLTTPGTPDSVPSILKFRPSKPYRHPTLDARLTKQRVLAEARVLVRLAGLAGEGVRVPRVWGVEWDVGRGKGGVGKGAWIVMEEVRGRSVKEVLRSVDAWSLGERSEQERKVVEARVRELLRRVGWAVGRMHDRGGVVHGDLTSSNVMVRQDEGSGSGDGLPETEGEIVLIDFGLATQASQDEDRAVDLYVLERAFGSTHPKQEDWFMEEVLMHQDGYSGSFKGSKVVLRRLEDVRARGRKRTMIG